MKHLLISLALIACTAVQAQVTEIMGATHGMNLLKTIAGDHLIAYGGGSNIYRVDTATFEWQALTVVDECADQSVLESSGDHVTLRTKLLGQTVCYYSADAGQTWSQPLNNPEIYYNNAIMFGGKWLLPELIPGTDTIGAIWDIATNSIDGHLMSPFSSNFPYFVNSVDENIICSMGDSIATADNLTGDWTYYYCPDLDLPYYIPPGNVLYINDGIVIYFEEFLYAATIANLNTCTSFLANENLIGSDVHLFANADTLLIGNLLYPSDGYSFNLSTDAGQT
jgi:hypothetical protein